MRPQSALLPKQHKKIHFNQQFAYFYILNSQGQQLKVNKQGQLISKFVKDFSGFCNFKERKNRSLKDKTLMYSQPKLDYSKDNGFVCPKGDKFLGYAQFPYDLKGALPIFLQETTFNESCQVRQSQKQMKNAPIQIVTPSTENNSTKTIKALNKFQSLKILQSSNPNFVSFDYVRNEKKSDSFLGSRCQKLNTSNFKSDKKQEKNIILQTSQKYGQQHRIKSANSKSTLFLHSTNTSNNFIKPNSQRRQASYFQQSLSNIEKTETPNYLTSSSPSQQILNFTQSDSLANPFYQTSVKSKCYKSSCHYAQYIPKRRYMKENRENNLTTMEQYKKELDGQLKEKEIVEKLKDQLKIYQPVQAVVAKTEQKNVEKGGKEKSKATQAQSSSKK